MIVGCKGTGQHGPTLDETVQFMQSAMTEHDGLRLQGISPDVLVKNRLTTDHCKLTLEATQFEVIRYDFADIDTRTIKVEQIGNAWWVTFDTRSFHRSVVYNHPEDHKLDYTTGSGGFSFNSKGVADSVAKAVAHAAELCGSGPSTF
jgi:hypothetical protein